MVINEKKDKKEIIDLLLYKWEYLSLLGAMQTLYQSNKKHDLSSYLFKVFTISHEEIAKQKPVEKIFLIKYIISTILPKAKMILPDYEFDGQLSPGDFIELYTNHQKMSIKKVREMINENKKD